MKRTSLSLSDELAHALSREARRRSTSISQVAREALERQLGIRGQGARELPFASLGASGQRSTARDMEDLLAREWGGKARRR